ncbi:GNAT family N-acetyltransferase [Paroceanicella profunda]|uniref:GNAT family N-acetyltransferase n=1 Tax=Paroceanicella profunda TaxID=2579971 RepID=A0A5B8FS94_9RHOB|nr:GNAT family N-acetyltransferase [Paroceanicella profunda]QDL91235.1 GNAT family N-acetyltransferase [Paroceanicella profunda]
MIRFDTARLRIRPYREADLPGHRALRADPDIDRFMHWTPDHAAFERHLLAQGDRAPGTGRGWVNLAVADRQSDRLIGDHALRVDGDLATLGLALAPEMRGRGLGRELVMARLARLPETVWLVRAEIDTANLASRALFGACGFTLESEMEDADGPYLVMSRAPRRAAP